MSSPDNCSITIVIERVDGSWFASATGYDRGFGVCAGKVTLARLYPESTVCVPRTGINWSQKQQRNQ